MLDNLGLDLVDVLLVLANETLSADAEHDDCQHEDENKDEDNDDIDLGT